MEEECMQKYLHKGSVVRVTLDKEAYVLLMDPEDYDKFKHYCEKIDGLESLSGLESLDELAAKVNLDLIGELVTKDHLDITVPKTGNWYIVIRSNGLGGNYISNTINVIEPEEDSE